MWNGQCLLQKVILKNDHRLKIILHVNYIPICNKSCHALVIEQTHHVISHNLVGWEFGQDSQGSAHLYMVVASGSVLIQVIYRSKCFLILHMASHLLPMWSPYSVGTAGLPSMTVGFQKQKHRSPREPFLPLSIGQSKSPVQPSFKEWGNKPHLLMRGTTKWLCNWHGLTLQSNQCLIHWRPF